MRLSKSHDFLGGDVDGLIMAIYLVLHNVKPLVVFWSFTVVQKPCEYIYESRFSVFLPLACARAQ